MKDSKLVDKLGKLVVEAEESRKSWLFVLNLRLDHFHQSGFHVRALGSKVVFDFTHLNSLTVHLNLVVASTHEAECSIGIEISKIGRPVHATDLL